MRQAESPGRGISQAAFPPASYPVLSCGEAVIKSPVLGNCGMGVARVKPGGLFVCFVWHFVAVSCEL